MRYFYSRYPSFSFARYMTKVAYDIRKEMQEEAEAREVGKHFLKGLLGVGGLMGGIGIGGRLGASLGRTPIGSFGLGALGATLLGAPALWYAIKNFDAMSEVGRKRSSR